MAKNVQKDPDPASFDPNDPVEAGLEVTLPSGATFKVLTQAEVEYVQDRTQRYHDEFHYNNVSDLQDVDRIVVMELLIYRWGLFISRGVDYFNEAVVEQNLQKSLNEYSREIRQVKQSLGMDKASRDKERGEDSVATYLENLRKRALEFAVNRNKMMDKGLELSQQVIALATLWNNTTEDERAEFNCTSDDVCKWLWEVYKPEFEAVDEEFRRTSQKYWVASL